MAVYKDFKLTNKGIDLFAELLQGSGEMEFRYLAAGSGSYAEGENSEEYIRGMGSLKEERQRVPFTSVKKMDGGMVSLKADLSNQGLTESYLMTEVGIYAGIAGTEESVLYCVTTPESPDYMPDFSSGRLYNVVFRTLVSIGDAEEITVVYTPDNYVSKEELQDALKNKVDSEDGKGLSSNNFSDQDKEAIDGLNGLKFGQDAEGNWGYTAPNTTGVIPFGKGGGAEIDGRFERIVIGSNNGATFKGGEVFARLPSNFEFKHGHVFIEIAYSLHGAYNGATQGLYSTGMILLPRDTDNFKVQLDGMFLEPSMKMLLKRVATIKNASPNVFLAAGNEIVVSQSFRYNLATGTFTDGGEDDDIYLVPRICFLYVNNKTIYPDGTEFF